MTDRDLQDLLQRVLSGDAASRAALMELLRPRLVLWFAARMDARLRSKLEPEDLAQDALLRVHDRIQQLRSPDPRAFRAWTFRLAEHRLLDVVDRWGAAKRTEQEIPRLTRSPVSPVGAASLAESVSSLRSAIATLSEDHRRVIQLLRIEERDTVEVARLMSRSVNAVRILHCRALRALRDAMQGDA